MIYLVLFVMMSILVLISLLIYMGAYKRRINRKLTHCCDNKNKPMMSPLCFLIICILSASALYVLLICVLASVVFVPAEKDLCKEVQIGVSHCGESSILSEFSPDDDIQGYNRTEQINNNFRLVCYASDSGKNLNFPDVLVHMEYTGDDTEVLYGYDIRSSDDDCKLSGDQDPFCCDEKNGIWLTLSGTDCNTEIILNYYTLTKENAQELNNENGLKKSKESGEFAINMKS